MRISILILVSTAFLLSQSHVTYAVTATEAEALLTILQAWPVLTTLPQPWNTSTANACSPPNGWSGLICNGHGGSPIQMYDPTFSTSLLYPFFDF